MQSRRDYLTEDRGYGSERVRVTGFATVAIGIGAEARTEKWCRVRFANGGAILMHPESLRPAPAQSSDPT